MEEAIRKHDAGEAGEPDWENADWAWARTALRAKHAQSFTVVERTNLCRKLREETRESNQVISREELKSQSDYALLKMALEWRKSVRQGEEDSLSKKDKSRAGVHSLSPSLTGIRSAPEGRSIEDQSMLDEHQRMLIRLEYSRTLTLDERTEMRVLLREEHPGASLEEIRILFAERLMVKALEAHAREELSAALSERIKEDELLVRGPAQDALLIKGVHSLALRR
jgi:hypothetical protein